jgi:pimeloyl-ACP methyl ester carboxylesterase
VAHSRGGIAATQAAEGRHESISTLVYLAADMLRDGESVLDVALGDSESLVLPNLV